MIKMIPETPEHDKMRAISEESHKIGEFLGWLDERGLFLCQFRESIEEFIPIGTPYEKLLADYFGINLDNIEEEKVAMLVAVRGEP